MEENQINAEFAVSLQSLQEKKEEISLNLPSSIAKKLLEKSYDKRKQAATEFGKIIQTCVQENKMDEIIQWVKYFKQEFIQSPYNINKKGGLIALSAICIACAKSPEIFTQIFNELYEATLSRIYDNDSSVRYHACETLFNVLTTCRSQIFPFFQNIYTVLLRLLCDVEQDVRQAAGQIDNLLKNIVKECDKQNQFNLEENFIPLIKPQLQVHNTTIRHAIIS